VICLLSALRFHELTTQQPNEVWLAIGSKAWRPVVDSVTVRFAYYGERSLKAGVTTHVVEGVSVKIFSAAKTPTMSDAILIERRGVRCGFFDLLFVFHLCFPFFVFGTVWFLHLWSEEQRGQNGRKEARSPLLRRPVTRFNGKGHDTLAWRDTCEGHPLAFHGRT
jgi:hypothetical protein